MRGTPADNLTCVYSRPCSRVKARLSRALRTRNENKKNEPQLGRLEARVSATSCPAADQIMLCTSGAAVPEAVAAGVWSAAAWARLPRDRRQDEGATRGLTGYNVWFRGQ